MRVLLITLFIYSASALAELKEDHRAELYESAKGLARCHAVYMVAAGAVESVATAQFYKNMANGARVSAMYLLWTRGGGKGNFGAYSHSVDAISETHLTTLLVDIEHNGTDFYEKEVNRCVITQDLQAYIVDEIRQIMADFPPEN
ncbi:MAG: hypothetical protein AB2792_22190 [Candidatus Thiodiazotropha sp.]